MEEKMAGYKIVRERIVVLGCHKTNYRRKNKYDWFISAGGESLRENKLANFHLCQF